MTGLSAGFKNELAFASPQADRLKDSFIELDGALVGALTQRPTHVAIYFPRVPLYLRGRGAGEVTPRVEAELRLWGATVEQAPRRLPRRLSKWEIRCRGTALAKGLPLGFAVSGRVHLTIEFDRDQMLAVSATRASLRILKRVSQLAPPPARTRARERRRPRPSSARRRLANP